MNRSFGGIPPHILQMMMSRRAGNPDARQMPAMGGGQYLGMRPGTGMPQPGMRQPMQMPQMPMQFGQMPMGGVPGMVPGAHAQMPGGSTIKPIKPMAY